MTAGSVARVGTRSVTDSATPGRPVGLL